MGTAHRRESSGGTAVSEGTVVRLVFLVRCGRRRGGVSCLRRQVLALGVLPLPACDFKTLRSRFSEDVLAP